MSRIRPTTTAWGIFLALTGGVIIMIASGTRFNLTSITVIALTLLGVAALVLAILPRPKPRAEVTVTRLVADPNSPFSDDVGAALAGTTPAPATAPPAGAATLADELLSDPALPGTLVAESAATPAATQAVDPATPQAGNPAATQVSDSTATRIIDGSATQVINGPHTKVLPESGQAGEPDPR